MRRPARILGMVAAAVLVFGARTLPSYAQSSPLHFGIEWGLSEKFFDVHNYNFLTEEGLRVDDNGAGTDFHGNMFLLARAGACIADLFTISACAGYAGISRNRRIIPVTGLVTITPNGRDSDGFTAFLGSGIGIHDVKSDYVLFLGRAGAGYRYVLDNSVSLDLNLGMQVTLDHPEIWNPVEQKYVLEQRVLESNAFYLAMTLSLAVNF